MTVDFLIVGQGLAGSLLAWQLIERGQRVLVVDPGLENASLIAAGLINPITGMRLVKTEQFESLSTMALDCYRRLERMFNQRFYHAKPMLRLLRKPSELSYAQKRLTDLDYQSLIGHLTYAANDAPMLATLEQQQTGYLQTRQLLTALLHYFIERQSYRSGHFDYLQLDITRDAIRWQDIVSRHVIFCEGYRLHNNPWFSWLPLQPVKGEIVSFSGTGALSDQIYNYGHWLIPGTIQGHYRTGATFDHDRIDSIPSETGKQHLLAALEQFVPALSQPNITAHQANIRPCTRDKNPFIGRHPEHPNLIVFNGFGAKGSLLIPWHSHRLIDHLLHSQPLAPDADIKRYQTTYFPGR